MEPLLLQVPDDLTHQGTLYTVQLDSIILRSRLAMARMLAVHSCLMGLESTLALLVLVSKYLWSYILGIYSIFSVLVYVFFYFGHNYYFLPLFPQSLLDIILTSCYAR